MPYTFNRLLQEYKHSPTIAHVLAKILVSLSPDNLIRGDPLLEIVGEAARVMWQALCELEVQTPPETQTTLFN